MQIYLLIATLIALQQTEWVTYMDEYKTFSIMIPTEMEVVKDKFLIDIGEIEVVSHRCLGSTKDPNELYIVQEYDYPDNFISPDSTRLMKEMINTALHESVEKLAGSLDYQRPINIYEHPGVLYRITFAGRQKVMKGKIFIVDGTYYSLQVYTKIETSLNDNIDKFLSSFTILF